MRRRSRHQRTPEGARACVVGGAVTREQLLDAARRDGRQEAPIVRILTRHTLPATADLARAFAPKGGFPRLDSSLVRISPRAARLLDRGLMRRERCVPLEILDEICVLAVEAGYAESAVRAVRAALQRDVVPVLVRASVLDRVLEGLPAAARALRLGVLRRKDSRVHERFRALVLEGEALDAVPLPDEEFR
jgi:hypothetical protein